MVGSRRVRKRSTSVCPLLPTYVGLLEPLQLSLQSARDNKRPLFVLQVQRRANCNDGTCSSSSVRSSWSSPRPFEDFEELHQRLTLALQHGHFCNAGCPWLFSFLTSEFPKKHILQRSSSPRRVETRRAKLQELLTSTLEFLLDRKNHACSVATTNVAKLLAEFLYGEDAIAQYILESYSEAETTSTSNSSRRRSLGVQCSDQEDATSNQDASSSSCSGEVGGLSICGVCNGALGVGSDVSPANSARGRSSVYATVLKCGHQFHDECIVPVLNETLRCPTCHHLEIQ
ncbi:hypothetical protein PHYSODRAFT_560438 [Phytophthora sojae]|uniref:RING-type domain-containing protein n=1 Tax=Phytophthora sojae (strain P6497) TaxID=1094619 RepID=G4ZG84_PHYSP|nr:hypothetical protein PHYSODRAFT_560438 [Phytophthora sojae]EGZ17987.1 hypothetical protein PHYSODRAFT_560438 [Phytophthora sojae]|eukprot:XP_009527045.1 hypothetical protein PHYSODRAFT_560438 [Phytophthora sojae]